MGILQRQTAGAGTFSPLLPGRSSLVLRIYSLTDQIPMAGNCNPTGFPSAHLCSSRVCNVLEICSHARPEGRHAAGSPSAHFCSLCAELETCTLPIQPPLPAQGFSRSLLCCLKVWSTLNPCTLLQSNPKGNHNIQ